MNIPEKFSRKSDGSVVFQACKDSDDYAAKSEALAAAPTPPAPEVESVEPVGKKSQYQDQRGRWYDCADDDLEFYAERGEHTRTLYIYADQPKLYTRPANDGLRKAAEKALDILEDYHAAEMDIADAISILKKALAKLK